MINTCIHRPSDNFISGPPILPANAVICRCFHSDRASPKHGQRRGMKPMVFVTATNSCVYLSISTSFTHMSIIALYPLLRLGALDTNCKGHHGWVHSLSALHTCLSTRLLPYFAIRFCRTGLHSTLRLSLSLYLSIHLANRLTRVEFDTDCSRIGLTWP